MAGVGTISLSDLLSEHLSKEYKNVRILHTAVGPDMPDCLLINDLFVAWILSGSIDFSNRANDKWSHLSYDARDPEFFKKLDLTLNQMITRGRKSHA